MRKFYQGVVKHRKWILTFFLILATACAVLKNFVAVNYDMNDYLPKGARSTAALEVMEQEFEGGIPNARVMVNHVTIPEALEYKEKLKAVDGVTDVAWLDDVVDITLPASMMDPDTLETYYMDHTALFTVTIEKESRIRAAADIRKIIGDENAMSGSAISTAAATLNTVSEIQKIAVVAVLFVLFVLILTTGSWAEPLMILTGLGIAIVINDGTNLMFGEISFVTNAAGSILQLAVSLDYSVFLIHRFEECRKGMADTQEAMVHALCKSTSSILSSGLTTVIGFLALALMQFRIGPDLGFALAKGVAVSLIVVFLFMPSLILAAYPWLDKTKHRPFVPGFRKFGEAVSRIAVPMVCLFAVVMVPAYLGSNANEYYYGSSKIFNEETQLGRDIASIEEIFGQRDTYVLLVPRGDTAAETALSDELHELPQITSILSYVDLAGAEIPLEYLNEDTLSQIMSENYSRMALSVDVAYEGEETFSLVESIRNIAQSHYPDTWYLAGEGASTYDLMDTVTVDMVKVNLAAIAAVFIILLLTMRSVMLPVILVLGIETAIWLNLSCPYFMDQAIFYIAYLIISSIQLGATVDYAILMTDRYKENRRSLPKKEAVRQTVSDVTVSILTSGSALTVVGLLLGYVSTNQLLAQLGIFIGRGAIFSLAVVLLVLPGLLFLFDQWITGTKKKQKHKKFVFHREVMAMNRFHLKNFISVFLASALFAAALPISVSAMEANTEKEEVVYVNMGNDGLVEEIHVVNIFGDNTKEEIIDYGNYSDVRNMTTTDTVDYSSGTVKIRPSAEKLYYEGKLESLEMPWDIQIRYFLDGKEYTAEEIAGKSGNLKMAIRIAQNRQCQGGFYDHYALQASLSFDTDLCKEIVAPDATIANVGSKKQLTYTVLPGKGADIRITAKVSAFEMDGMSINAIPLNLNIEVEDEELMDQVAQLLDAISQLDDGASKLQDGASDLQDGAQSGLKSGVKDLKNGAGQLYSGAAELKEGGSNLQNGAADLQNGINVLDEGIHSLNSGIVQMQEALAALNQKSPELVNGSASFQAALLQLQKALGGVSLATEDISALTDASSAIKTGIGNLVTGATDLKNNVNFNAYKAVMSQNGLDIDGLRQKNEDAASSLEGLAASLAVQIETLKNAGINTSEIESQVSQLSGIISLLGANNASIGGTESYLEAANANLSSLLHGATALQQSYAAFDVKIGELANIIRSLAYRMSELSSAVNSLVSEYGKLDRGIGGYTDAVAKIAASYSQITDGVSGLAAGSSALKTGSKSLYSGTGELLSGIVELYNGTGSLKDGTGTLDDGVAELLFGIAQLSDGVGELKEGTSTMRAETKGMDTEVADQIDGLVETVTGGDFAAVSFVSEKNTNVQSVQFVMKTNGIQKEEASEGMPEAQKKLTAWQKFLNLFGLYRE